MHNLSQENAWCDTAVARAYANIFIRKTTEDLPKLLLLDNLRAHTSADFLNTLQRRDCTQPFFGPSGCTDKWQPIDAGLARDMKTHISEMYDDFLINNEKCVSDEHMPPKKKRVLLTKWVGEAWEKTCSKADFIKRYSKQLGFVCTLMITPLYIIHISQVLC